MIAHLCPPVESQRSPSTSCAGTGLDVRKYALVPPRVFISYTHDSGSHGAAVLRLGKRLRQDGVDARLDALVSGTPPQGWPAWMEDELERADFVIIVCSKPYYERYRGRGDPQEGRGGRWEANLIRNHLYANPLSLARFVPLIAEGATEIHVPDRLRHAVTHYRLAEDDYVDLVRFLTSMHAQLPPIGHEGAQAGTRSFGSPVTPQMREADAASIEQTIELASLADRAHGLFAQGQYDAALQLYERVLPMWVQQLGPDHDSTMSALHRQVYCLVRLERFDEALPLCKRLVTVRERALGYDHRSTRDARSWLVRVARCAAAQSPGGL